METLLSSSWPLPPGPFSPTKVVTHAGLLCDPVADNLAAIFSIFGPIAKAKANLHRGWILTVKTIREIIINIICSLMKRIPKNVTNPHNSTNW
jgi:phosphatidylglycerophosphate synthase